MTQKITTLERSYSPSGFKKTARATVAVVGLGYVGLPLAILAERKGYRVFGIDIDSEKIAALRVKSAPFLNTGEKEQFRQSKMQVSTSGENLKYADVVLVCVPTPVYENHLPNLEPVRSATELVADNLQAGQLVVIESTINPGVCQEVIIPILEGRSGLTLGKDFYLAHCPERINPGDQNFNVENISRVIGANDSRSLERAISFYQSILEAEVHPMKSLKEAEAVKVVENSFRDINIAFVNELAMSFDTLGIDVVNVINGAKTKPFAFIPHYPGCGVGGHCIPVDPYYLIDYAAQNGFTHRFLSIARDINNHMPEFTIKLLESLIKENRGDKRQEQHVSLRGMQIALLGLSYKRDVPDMRESPALEIRKLLREKGALVRTYDPVLPHLSSARTLDEALVGADGVIVATDHKLFRSLGPDSFLTHGIKIVVDGRNCLAKEQFLASGIAYKGIGR